MSSEASAALYSMSTFILMDKMDETCVLQAFLDCIGRLNAGSLSRLCINFPTIGSQPENLGLGKDGLQSIKLLQGSCTGLKTLEYIVYSKSSSGSGNTDRDNLQLSREAFPQLNRQLHAIPSLREFFNDAPADVVIESIQSFGWVVLPRDRDQW